MAKNISILEQAVSRTFGSVEKLETNLVGGGTQLWIPEDEAVNYVELEDLDVTENGYYTPSGDGFKSVSVEVESEPELEEIEITENGTYTPTSGVGFSSVSVEVQSESGGDSPEISGTEMEATAETDITIGETVAIRSASAEPIGVSCPLTGRMFDQYGNGSPIKFNGTYIYWINYVDPATREVRRKRISNMASESYEVVGQIPTGWGGSDPWYCKEAVAPSGDEEGYNVLASVYSNRTANVPYSGSVIGGGGAGQCISVYGDGIYDKNCVKVNDTSYQNSSVNAWRMISSSRVFVQGSSGTFSTVLLGGQTATNYTISNYDQLGIDTIVSGTMTCGNNYVFMGYDSSNPSTKYIYSAPFDESEYDQPREVEATLITQIDCSSYVINADTAFDRWAIGTDNGLVVINSDLSFKVYENITSAVTPYLVGDYVFLGSSCYQLSEGEATMYPTSSKGAEGVLGVAKSNVAAGETGTAIVLFS